MAGDDPDEKIGDVCERVVIEVDRKYEGRLKIYIQHYARIVSRFEETSSVSNYQVY